MTRNRIPRTACVVALTLAAVGQPYAAPAQVRGLQAGSGVLTEVFSFRSPSALGMDNVVLVTAPFAVRFSGPVTVEVAGAYAHATLMDADGGSSTLEGLTDTSIRLVLPLASDRITLAGAAYLPTGKATQTTEEARVASVIAADLLPFSITNWGTGGGFDVSAAVAVPVGDFGLGARFGFAAAREFEPLVGGPDVFRYQPGNQLYARLAVDRRVGAAGKAALSATMQRFADDAFNGQNLYRSGDRLEFLATLNTSAGGSASASVYGGVLH
ncbi:MAG: hypothetical protein ACREMA_07665, partial [Longimicrobiales bacterium]